MGSSVGLNANEQGLLRCVFWLRCGKILLIEKKNVSNIEFVDCRLKQRFPWAFHDVCLFSDVCYIMASYGYRLRARRFLHELFMDSPFDEVR
jgi:hypothetical protein